MRYGDICAHVNPIRGTVTIADHLFDLHLTPHEALALLHWLHQKEHELQALEGTTPQNVAFSAANRHTINQV
ncbi:MAG: hypothetical protein M5U01_41340 [Ardenticatenaceae bacterium]|nr:hypothetical protein [Ardenticatenaceae bacterium]HBY95108.1 hypothetical protein [Chloroflexota bacterium]